jgi:hypothetical protein
MKKDDLIENASILEAVDNLSSMAELNLEELGVASNEEESRLHLQTSHWLDLKNEEKTVSAVKDTFRVVHNYLKYVYKKEGIQLKDKEIQKGVKSIVALATEAANKVDQCVKLFKDKKNVSDSKEFKELMDFYEHKILKRFDEVLESEEAWEEEWSGEEDAADIQRRGLKDLESVTKDRDYELFYILKEDGSRFYNKNLLRHIRLVADFDMIIGSLSGDDPFVRIKIIQDRMAHEQAIFLKREIKSDLNHWIKQAGKYRDNYFVQIFYRSIMALLLASNPHNLLINKVGKGAISYFEDFRNYLRAVLDSIEYQQLIDNLAGEREPFFKEILHIVHKLCFFVYMNKPDYSPAFSLLTRVIGRKKKNGMLASLSLWNQVLDDHETLHSELKKFPSGPLFKVLDILHTDHKDAFDPYMQGDEPTFLCNLEIMKKEVGVLLSGAPIHQKQVDKASIIGEFSGALRYAKEIKKKFLLINLEDRTSWKEYARCHELEEFQKRAEVANCLDVVTLPKETDFYNQANEYLKLTSAVDFKKLLFEQVKSGEGCGFSIPKQYAKEATFQFMNEAIEWIHKRFFEGKEDLSRKNRLDFIEIFYNVFIIKILHLSGADYLLFASKDSVDTSALAAASFFAFIKLTTIGSDWKEEETELFMNTIFLRAFLVRERTVDVRVVSRAVSMLSVLSSELETNRTKMTKEMTSILS